MIDTMQFDLISPQSRILLENAYILLSYAWWIILPVILGKLFWGAWRFYLARNAVENMSWVMLRIRVPQDVMKSPKSMEQVFAAVHGTYSFGLRLYQKYWNGEMEQWTSFEIMADRNGPQFFIRVVSSYAEMMKSAVYGQYPDAEIEEADDYVKKFPAVLPNALFDLEGGDFILGGNNALPIRTYEYFESKEEEEKIDTIATLMEALSHHTGDETTWIQVIIRPVGRDTSDWVKQAIRYRDEKVISTEGKKPSGWEYIKAFFSNLISGVFGAESKWPEEKKPEKQKLMDLTEATKAKIEAIDRKISKIAFEGAIRWIYIDRVGVLNTEKTRGITAWAKQFVDENLNGLKPHLPSYTPVNRYPYKKRKRYIKKIMIYENAVRRRFPRAVSIFNTEELATLYHFPTAWVKAPMMGRVEAKKGTPPSQLPVE